MLEFALGQKWIMADATFGTFFRRSHRSLGRRHLRHSYNHGREGKHSRYVHRDCCRIPSLRRMASTRRV